MVVVELIKEEWMMEVKLMLVKVWMMEEEMI